MRVELLDVRKSYPLPKGGGSVTALDGIDLLIGSGDLCTISGPTGSGKTVLLNIIGGLSAPTSGRVRLDDELLRGCGSRHWDTICFGFQEPVFVPQLTVQENLLLPALRYGNRLVGGRGDRLLQAFGLAEMFDLFPAALSGGEKRRLNLARALLLDPRLLLLDEPVVDLDEAWKIKSMELVMEEVRATRATLVIASSSPVPDTENFRQVRMQYGKVSDDGTCDH